MVTAADIVSRVTSTNFLAIEIALGVAAFNALLLFCIRKHNLKWLNFVADFGLKKCNVCVLFRWSVLEWFGFLFFIPFNLIQACAIAGIAVVFSTFMGNNASS